MEQKKKIEDISKKEANQILYSCIDEFNDNIYNVRDADEFVISYNFHLNSTHCQGLTSFWYSVPEDKYRCEVKINKNLLKKGLEDILINTILHELCHAAVFRNFVDNNTFLPMPEELANKQAYQHGVFIREEYKEIFNREVNENGGHNGVWHKYANAVNLLLKPELKITPYCSIELIDRIIASSNKIPDYEIKCTKCGYSAKILNYEAEDNDTKNFVRALYTITKFNAPNYVSRPMCGYCRSPLTIIINNKNLKKTLDNLTRVNPWRR